MAAELSALVATTPLDLPVESMDVYTRLPPELQEYIIAQLGDDKHALSECSLVCSHWSVATRYHLFQHTTIRLNRKNFQQFCELLATQRLNVYIARLQLETHDRTLQFNHDLHRLTGLPSLKYLRLEFRQNNLLPQFFTACAANFQSVTDLELFRMYFDSFGQFMHLLDTLPLLRRLSVTAVNISSDPNHEDTWISTSSRPPNLVDFAVSYDVMPGLLSWLPSQTTIRRLAIWSARRNRDSDTPLLSTVLSTLGPHLEHLILSDTDISHPLDLSHCTALRTFELTGVRVLPDNTGADLEWLPTLLSSLNSPALRRIVLVVYFRSTAALDCINWPRIAKILEDHRSIQQVEIALSPQSLDWAAPLIAERFHPRHYVLRVKVRGRQYSLKAFGD
ncbi:hypothetical protein B0H16DRAFT_1522448 [Mycena metata]|uniref:F-box domain-containing protein n=1 Tax=Mycena metata TaxID=1033252 RepID=A0AAD7NLZ2_9AGAR|nr:hypothetical protein B0H16DRAFT_1522448 [Mycena metata]